MPIQEISPYFGVQMWNRAGTLRHEKTAIPWSGVTNGSMRWRKSPLFPRNPESAAAAALMNWDSKLLILYLQRAPLLLQKTDAVHYFGSVAGTGRYNSVANPWDVDAPPQPLELVFAVEHYNRILHILEEDIPVEMEIEVRTTVYRGDPNDFNVIAEIPGTDRAHEIVIVGGHLQSLPHGTGAIDNAAGSTTSIEAVRILKAIGARPRRTIRVGLWGGHDGGGLAGSRASCSKTLCRPGNKGIQKGL